MNQRSDWFEEFQRNISELIARSPAADIERNIKALMAQTFARLDLVTREEFEVQKTLLERALARIATLEQRIAALEAQQAGTESSGSAGSADSAD